MFKEVKATLTSVGFTNSHPSICEKVYSLVVYYLDGVTCSLQMVRIGHLPSTQKTSIYRKRLGQVQPVHNSKMVVLNCKMASTFSSRKFCWKFQDVPIISSRLVEHKLSYHLHSDRNFRDFWVNGKQPLILQIRWAATQRKGRK